MSKQSSEAQRLAYNARQKVQRRRRQALKLGTSYQQLLEEQGGVCAICGHPPQRQELCIDHDHQTGLIRGLLCHACNMALGLFKDDPGRLDAALTYLEFWHDEQEDVDEQPGDDYDRGMLKKPCPKCGKKKLLEGPAYDRGDIRCMNCGQKFRPKEKGKG